MPYPIRQQQWCTGDSAHWAEHDPAVLPRTPTGQQQWSLTALSEALATQHSLRCRGQQIIQAVGMLGGEVATYNPSTLTVYCT